MAHHSKRKKIVTENSRFMRNRLMRAMMFKMEEQGWNSYLQKKRRQCKREAPGVGRWCKGGKLLKARISLW